MISSKLSIQDTDSRQYLFLFIAWPFLAFLLALANYSQKESRKVVYFFLIYYGLTFVNTNEAIDAYGYIVMLQINAGLPFSDFFKIIGGLYSSTSVDIIEPLISFIISRFTGYHGIYFAVWAAIFGYFYLKSINLLYDRYKENPGWNTLIPMVFFITILPITFISGVRMWTAAWIFFYAAYHVVLNRDPKYIILALSASLLHWSFLSANAILLIYYFAGNRNFIYFPLAAASFVAPRLLFPIYSLLSLRMGGAIQSRFEGYSSEGYMMVQQNSLDDSSWFLQLGYNLIFFYLLFAIVIIQINTIKAEKDDSMRNLYSFLLLFLAFVNFGMPIPSFGGRFQIVFFLFATLYVFNYFVRIRAKGINLLTLIGLFPMLLYTAITFRMASTSISVWLFTPVFGSPFLAPAMSLFDLLFH